MCKYRCRLVGISSPASAAPYPTQKVQVCEECKIYRVENVNSLKLPTSDIVVPWWFYSRVAVVSIGSFQPLPIKGASCLLWGHKFLLYATEIVHFRILVTQTIKFRVSLIKFHCSMECLRRQRARCSTDARPSKTLTWVGMKTCETSHNILIGPCYLKLRGFIKSCLLQLPMFM